MTASIPVPSTSAATSLQPPTTTRPRTPRGSAVICATWLAVAAIETVIGVTAGWPSQFMGKGNPDKVASQWITMGTAISPPLFLFIAVALGGALAFWARRRALRMVGGVLITAVGLVSVAATLGEVTAAAATAVPTGAQWSSLVGTALSLALVVAGVLLTLAGRRSATWR